MISADPDGLVVSQGWIKQNMSCIEKDVRSRRWLAWGVAAAYAVLLSLAMWRHEMWRDEIQAWLLARDSPSGWNLIQALRYEGHPGLWHLLLSPLARFSWNPVWMQIAHGAIASAAVWVFVRHAPFWWPARILLPFSYVIFFEWGTIARNYSLSALLLFLFCAAYNQRWRRFPWAAAALALACHTNVHALLLVLVLTPLLMIDYAAAVANRWQDACRCKGRVAVAFGLVLMGVATAGMQLNPPKDSGTYTAWNWDWRDTRAAEATLTILRAHVPIPSSADGQFWNTCRPLKYLVGDGNDSGRLKAVAKTVGLVALGIAGLMLARRPWFWVQWVMGTLGLVVFFYVKHPGDLRHHAFHWLWAVIVLWLALQREPWKTGREKLDRILGQVEWGLIQVLLLLSATIQIWGCAVAVRADWRQVFSNAKAAAIWLRAEGLLAGNVCFAGQLGPEMSAVVGHAGLPRIYFTGPNRWGSYVVWDRKYALALHGPELAAELARLREREGREVVFLSSQPLDPSSQPEELLEMASFHAPNAWDPIWIYAFRPAARPDPLRTPEDPQGRTGD